MAGNAGNCWFGGRAGLWLTLTEDCCDAKPFETSQTARPRSDRLLRNWCPIEGAVHVEAKLKSMSPDNVVYAIRHRPLPFKYSSNRKRRVTKTERGRTIQDNCRRRRGKPGGIRNLIVIRRPGMKFV